MPFAELADSIVQSGRQTLENAIALVEGHPQWRARVVYGDTDSMFVLLPVGAAVLGCGIVYGICV